MTLFDLLNPFWSEHLLLQSPYRPRHCRELLREMGQAPLIGPATVCMKRNGKVGMQLRGFGNSGWKPRATLTIDDSSAGGSELRVRLDRSPGVKVLWILWPLVCISAVLTALVWDREPAKLMDQITQQLRARNSGVAGSS